MVHILTEAAVKIRRSCTPSLLAIHRQTQTNTHTYIHTYIHTYVYTCIHTYIHASYTHIHTYIHTYIHSYISDYLYLVCLCTSIRASILSLCFISTFIPFLESKAQLEHSVAQIVLKGPTVLSLPRFFLQRKWQLKR
jgi:hypothetical protein